MFYNILKIGKKSVFFVLLTILMTSSFINLYGMQEEGLTAQEEHLIALYTKITNLRRDLKALEDEQKPTDQEELVFYNVKKESLEAAIEKAELEIGLVRSMHEQKEQPVQPDQSLLENEENARNSELLIKWMKKSNAKPCPNCGEGIEKNSGCRAMLCEYGKNKEMGCKTHFCWNCMQITGVHTDDHSCPAVPKGQERNVGFVIDDFGKEKQVTKNTEGKETKEVAKPEPKQVNTPVIVSKKEEPKPVFQPAKPVNGGNGSRPNIRNRNKQH